MKEQYNILIVDDEKIVRDSLFHWFEEEGYNVDIMWIRQKMVNRLLRNMKKGNMICCYST